MVSEGPPGLYGMKSSMFLAGHPAPQTLPQTGTTIVKATNKTIPLSIFLDMFFSSFLFC
jgi:hypothetical protein